VAQTLRAIISGETTAPTGATPAGTEEDVK